MTIRKRTARILRKAASKLDPPRSLSDLARDHNRNAPQCKHGPEGVLNTGYMDPAELTKYGRDALAALAVNELTLDRGLPNSTGSETDEVTRHVAERFEAERRRERFE